MREAGEVELTLTRKLAVGKDPAASANDRKISSQWKKKRGGMIRLYQEAVTDF